ncbi:NAD+ synthase, partial [Serratia marcescens]|jgi:NAD+ synthase (glutamine-hydrolysing)
VYQALVLAVRDYVTKNGFKGAVLGLSGGIDSALTLAIAVDALGKDKVQALMMPFRYTADISIADAKEEAEILGVEFDIVSIEPMFDAFMGQLSPMFAGTERDTTEENLQARCRGVVLMALSNKRRSIVLTTGNKSEMAVGYATLYGDMAGGFDVLKDVPKTLVFKLSEYRNTVSYVIPQRVIDRPPSAELAPDQVDQDSLPPYDILDAILEGYVERDKSVADLVAEGFDEAIVRKVIRLVDINEYKRRQAAVGPRITARNFGKDRRYPITSGFGRKNW